jgi:small subunit ribosomal protein S21
MKNFTNNGISGVRVFSKDGEPFEKMMRRFKKKVEESRLIETLRKKESYEKPTTVNKRKKAAAKSRWQKKLKEQQLPQKLY